MILSKALRAAAGNTSPAAPTDPQFNYVSMLLHGDGTNGAQNNTFIDSSTNNFTITRNGNTTQGSLSPYGNLWSNWFGGSGSDWLNVGGGMPSGQGTEFTLEFWVYATTAKEHAFTQGTTAGTLDFSVNLSGAVYVADTGVVTIATSANNAFPYRSWVHIALTRTAGNLYTIYINGVSVGTGTNSTSMTANTTIGKHRGSTSRYFQGYMSNWRVTNTLVYTSNFTPPTAPLTAISGTSLLTCQSNRFIDNSANNFTITRNGDVRVTKEAPFLPTAAYSTSVIGGSGYFDGTGDYLSTSSVTFAGDFTVEGWVYINNLSSNRIMVQIGDDSTATGPAFYVTSTGKFNVYASSTIISGVANIVTNTWYHLAVCRSGSTVKSYVNGVLDVTTTNTATFTGLVRVGAEWFGGAVVSSSMMNGYISNLRLVAGTAVYTTNFTPPTAPLTAITNTQLLLNFTNAGIFDNAAENDLETVGNAQISTSVKKYGTGSMSFNGSASTYLLTNSGPQVEFGSGNFTIEMWVNFTTAPSNTVEYQLWHPVNHASGQKRLSILIYANTIGIGYFGTNVALTSALSWTTGQWYYLAFVRNGSTWTIYRDGTSVASGTNTSTLDVASGYYTGPRINGYIDDLRITKGVARYTANFTPPTAAFPDQ